VKKLVLSGVLVFSSAALLFPHAASAQQERGTTSRFDTAFQAPRDQPANVPAGARDAEQAVERAVQRFRIGLDGGVGLDPEIIMIGAHGAFGPIFTPDFDFRPGVEFGFGELTTLFGINLDVLYTLPGGRGNRWTPYVGGGPNFSLSHRGFETEADLDDGRSRFDFGDTDFEPGFNFIAGARARNGMFVELKATAYGVSNVRMMVGYNF
jgi:hypothetical protein